MNLEYLNLQMWQVSDSNFFSRENCIFCLLDEKKNQNYQKLKYIRLRLKFDNIKNKIIKKQYT